MTKLNEENLVAICDFIAAGARSNATAAETVGVHRKTLWEWLSLSVNSPDDARFTITFCGEKMRFHEAVRYARRQFLSEARDRFEHRVFAGDYRPIYFQGRPQFRERTDCLGCDDSTVRLMGYPHRWQLDENGEPIQLTEWVPPPVAAAVKVLEANFRQYSVRSEVSVKGALALGVHVVPQKKPWQAVEVAPAPKSLPPPSDFEEVEDAEPRAASDDEVADLLGPAREPEVVAAEAASEAEPAEVVTEPEMASPPVQQKPLSKLQMDLLDRLRQLREGGPKNPRPVGSLPNTGLRGDFNPDAENT